MPAFLAHPLLVYSPYSFVHTLCVPMAGAASQSGGDQSDRKPVAKKYMKLERSLRRQKSVNQDLDRHFRYVPSLHLNNVMKLI